MIISLFDIESERNLEPKSDLRPYNQGCGSGSVSGLDQDSIRCLDPEPDSESGSGSETKSEPLSENFFNPLVTRATFVDQFQ
jgi:hypothetical protein